MKCSNFGKEYYDYNQPTEGGFSSRTPTDTLDPGVLQTLLTLHFCVQTVAIRSFLSKILDHHKHSHN